MSVPLGSAQLCSLPPPGDPAAALEASPAPKAVPSLALCVRMDPGTGPCGAGLGPARCHKDPGL